MAQQRVLKASRGLAENPCYVVRGDPELLRLVDGQALRAPSVDRRALFGRASRGATLIEVLVGTFVFGFLLLASIAILNIGTQGWRNVESKSDVTRQLNHFEADVVQELKRASLASVGIYTPGGDYRWALWMKTAVNDPNRVVPASGAPLAPMGDPIAPVLVNNKPVMQRYVLYYVTRMAASEHQQLYGYQCNSYNSSGGPDTTCPHKWIVRKDIYLQSGRTTGNDTIGLQSDPTTSARLQTYLDDPSVTESALASEQESSTFAGATVHRVQIMAQNVLSFEVTRLKVSASSPTSAPGVDPLGQIILFDVKIFKQLNSANKIAVGQAPAAFVQMTTVGGVSMVAANPVQSATGSTTVHTESNVSSNFASFTVQLDNRVVPQNP